MIAKFSKILQLLLKHFALGLVRAYQLTLSPFLGGACRFEPSCSTYAVQVLQSHRPHLAIYFIFKRLSRCHPWGGHGYDPAPEKISIKERSFIS